jgi:ABC-type antimicrobial peptide transport system permease subunit
MPSYLDTLGIKLQSGRNFNAGDTLTSTPVAMINASMARALFPNEDPIGRRLRNPDPKNPVSYEIVGVLPDVGFAVGVVPSQSPYQVWRPLAQETWNYVSVAVRGQKPELLGESLRQTIIALDPNLAIQQFGIISEVTKMVTASAAMLGTVLAWGAGLGVFLAALGLYGVIARVVAQRTAEIGVRIALGAQGTDVVWLILRSGLKLTLIGSVLGLLGSAALSWGMSRISPTPAGQESMAPTLAAATVLLLVIGLLACWLPARRASKVDPMVALRAE